MRNKTRLALAQQDAIGAMRNNRYSVPYAIPSLTLLTAERIAPRHFGRAYRPLVISTERKRAEKSQARQDAKKEISPCAHYIRLVEMTNNNIPHLIREVPATAGRGGGILPQRHAPAMPLCYNAQIFYNDFS